MAKLQFILLATAFFIGSNIDTANANTPISSKQQPQVLTSSLKRSPDKSGNNIENTKLGQYRIAQQESEKPSSSGDEMIDALENRQRKIEKLKELGELNKILKQEKTLDTLQEENFNVDSLEELEAIKAIINDDLGDEEMLEALQQQDLNIESLSQLKQLRKIVGTQPAIATESTGISSPLAFRLLTIGLPATLLVFLIVTPFVKGIVGVAKSNYQEKYGKSPVPEGSVSLHNRALKEITLIGNKAEKINNDKFGSEEFLLLVRIKINMSKEAEGYQGLGKCVDLMQAAIIAQKSFLRLEQTELRYRSRKQQQFYQYVADNLEEDLDKEAFAEKINQKQAEILPSITTEEGKAAIATYVKEINILSKYKLGLKLLALFKQYELKDFSILKRISDVLEGLQGADLISSNNLISPVLENYESFEKLGPILGISEAESTPKAYAKILQVMGLTDRHGKAYLEFEQLVELLKKWEQPYKTISMIRNEYTQDKYTIPPEFKEDIPGTSTYQKYAEYLADL